MPPTNYLSARLSAELLAKIAKMAEQERRSVSSMANILLEEAVAARSTTTTNSSPKLRR